MSLLYGLEEAPSSPSGYDLTVTPHDDATVHPADGFHIPRQGAIGILDRDGQPVRMAGLERYKGAILGEPARSDAPVVHRDQEVIFGGYISHHYGHFLLETLSRLWAYKDSTLPVVWAAGRSFTPWAQEVLRLIGIPQSRHLILREPTRFARILVPAPGYMIPHTFHHRQMEALATVPCVAGEAKIYLSRRAFGSKIYHVEGEERLEALLLARGWQIIAPETLPIAGQIALFASARVVAGIEGSALHSVVLCKAMKARLIVLRRQTRNRNFDTIARTTGIDQVEIAGRIADDPNDGTRATLKDPAAVAARLDEIAEG